MSNPSQPTIIQEADTWLALDKPAGIVVHDVPGEKHAGTTLVDWLRATVPAIQDNFSPDDQRAGIVHRLDADTSGVILVAKDPNTVQLLQDQFRARTTEKIYQALVLGDPGQQGRLTGAIGRVGEDTRHTVRRLSFSWDTHAPKPAETSFTALTRYTDKQGREYTLVELQPKTGRTHQLRVQLLDHDTPIIGDPMYNTKASREASESLGLHRQFLHACSLQFTDPETEKRVLVTSELATDLQETIQQILPH